MPTATNNPIGLKDYSRLMRRFDSEIAEAVEALIEKKRFDTGNDAVTFEVVQQAAFAAHRLSAEDAKLTPRPEALAGVGSEEVRPLREFLDELQSNGSSEG